MQFELGMDMKMSQEELNSIDSHTNTPRNESVFNTLVEQLLSGNFFREN